LPLVKHLVKQKSRSWDRARSRTRVPLVDAWRFQREPSPTASGLHYDDVKAWVLPCSDSLRKTPVPRPPPSDLDEASPWVSPEFDDGDWQLVDLPHDSAIAGPYTDSVSCSMGHLPSPGVTWYRKTLHLPADDAGKSLFVDFDGAMSHSLVWFNGCFVGGWPSGYTSFRIELTRYARWGDRNVLVVRLDNPVPTDARWQSGSSRWYPGAGIYRNVWLVSAGPLRVGHWGTFVTTPVVSEASATVALQVCIENTSSDDTLVNVTTQIYELDERGVRRNGVAARTLNVLVPASGDATVRLRSTISNPKLWGPPPTQRPNRYLAVTTLRRGGLVLDEYETRFGIRTVEFRPDTGCFVNGERIRLQGVCNHHDLGALGTAVNVRALERQLDILAEMGCNAIRTAHNPPAPELLELTDRRGFLVVVEAFDAWAKGKTALDYHRLFEEWHEPDLRALIRRDRNHPSVVMWSIGNEVVEQGDGAEGAAIAAKLVAICHEEDPTRPTVSGMNSADPESPFAKRLDVIGLNYQGTGVQGGPARYPHFHERFTGKPIVGTETTNACSGRGVYTFPVAPQRAEPAKSGPGVDDTSKQVCSYDLYFAEWSYPPDEEFESQDRFEFVAGEFVWTGFDFLGEPTPFDESRSSHCGIVDLAGFKKDRFYLYQARWRCDVPMAHLLPHWTWPERMGQATPVFVYTSGDEAELFLNGVSLGRKQKAQFEYRLRWDDVVYEPGELEVVTYKAGRPWAKDSVRTAGDAQRLSLTTDRNVIDADGRDLAFLTVCIVDGQGVPVPQASNLIRFELDGPGELVATDNGNPTDRTVFSSPERHAFSGMALAIVRATPGRSGKIAIQASSPGLEPAAVEVAARERAS